jgi:hypothetical protein
MRIQEGAVHRLADNVVRAVLKSGFLKATADEKQLVARIAKLLLDNLRTEEEIEHEAEALAAKLGRQAMGMDQRKLVEGLKARLAKERGFAL